MNECAASLRIAAIILAAGAATRMGKLKQLLPFQGRTLLEGSLRQAVEAGFDPIVIVLGAQAEIIREAFLEGRARIIENVAWQLGMGSSLAAGFRYLESSHADVDAAAVLLADQPLVRANHLLQMARLLASQDVSAVAAEYNSTTGVPAIFTRQHFETLANVDPATGARGLLRSPGLNVAKFPLPEAAADIDTPEDFARLVGQST